MKNYFTKISVITVFFGYFLTSCISTQRGFQSSPVIARNVNLDPIKADLVVDEKNKLKGESSSTYFLWLLRISGDNTSADGINYSSDASPTFFQRINPIYNLKNSFLNKIRGAAAFKALSSGNYDVLVHPNYITKKENYLIFQKYTVTVEGYGAKYANFRTEKQKIVILESGKEIVVQDK